MCGGSRAKTERATCFYPVSRLATYTADLDSPQSGQRIPLRRGVLLMGCHLPRRIAVRAGQVGERRVRYFPARDADAIQSPDN